MRYLLMAAAILAGCSEGEDGCGAEEADDDARACAEDGGGLVTGEVTATCSTGVRWTGGDSESSLMRPGGDCIGCHVAVGEGPRYLVAGTVHGAVADEDDCAGLQGAVVRITGADDKVYELTTNAAGNFSLSECETIALPYTASVSFEGQTLPMLTPQEDLNCATCHTAEGAQEAPGRITLPSGL